MKSTSHFVPPLLATCPACGLLCDDIAIDATSPDKTIKIKNGCTKTVAFFQQSYTEVSPSIAGKSADLASAIQAAATILKASHQPLFAGLGTEVNGMRAIMRLAQKTNATLDHMHSEATVRNTLALQNSGWQTTTLTEVKNRADLILAIGTDIVSSHPHFFEKLVWNKDSLFDKAKPEVIYLGSASEAEKLPEILNALNALANGKKLAVKAVADITIESLQAILDKFKTAQYAVVVWSAKNLNFSHAELTIQSITKFIATLNEKTRVMGLPLNSGDGDTSINYASTWLSGYATRTRFSNEQPEYNPQAFSTEKQLKSCDALLWISTFNPIAPPQITSPTIMIGHPNTLFTTPPDVFIPVGIPGLDHNGTMFRMDGAVALPLKKVRHIALPTLSEVLHQIEALLP